MARPDTDNAFELSATAVGAHVDPQRLVGMQRHMDGIGATPRGGVHRLALAGPDLEARATLMSWARTRGYRVQTDALANLFITRPGLDPTALPVLCGSHTDSQPYAGRFDGMYGVLAAFEALAALDDAGAETKRPVVAVVWTGEEGGARFPVGTIGSSAFAGRRKRDELLNLVGSDGISLGEAVGAAAAAHPAEEVELGFPIHAYVEVHIEQGRLLEEAGVPVGIVTGIQGLRRIAVEVTGTEAHAGTTPRRYRRDALEAANALIAELRELCRDDEDLVRFTVGEYAVRPNAAAVVPGHVRFVIDLRHPERPVLEELVAAIRHHVEARSGPCETRSAILHAIDPVKFASDLVEGAEKAARAQGQASLRLVSGANHDASPLASVCGRTTMLFIPCVGGVSHNEAEAASDADLVSGARVLSHLVYELACE